MEFERLIKRTIDVNDIITAELSETIESLQQHIDENKGGFFSFDKEEDHNLIQELIDAHKKVLEFYSV